MYGVFFVFNIFFSATYMLAKVYCEYLYLAIFSFFGTFAIPF